MVDLLKQMMQPASISCVLLLLTPGVVLMHVKPLAVWGRRWVTAVVVMFWTLSCPLTTDLMARSLTGGYTALVSSGAATRATAIVMLGAGTTNLRWAGQQLSIVSPTSGLRALEASRLFTLLNGPLVIASGGVTERGEADAAPETDAFKLALTDLGVPADRIVLESQSKNTHDQAVVMKEVLRERGIAEFVLVTSPLHMRRSMYAFQSQGLHPVAAIAPLYPERHDRPFPLLPTDAALAVGSSVVYEWVARAYYWWKGWL